MIIYRDLSIFFLLLNPSWCPSGFTEIHVLCMSQPVQWYRQQWVVGPLGPCTGRCQIKIKNSQTPRSLQCSWIWGFAVTCRIESGPWWCVVWAVGCVIIIPIISHYTKTHILLLVSWSRAAKSPWSVLWGAPRKAETKPPSSFSLDLIRLCIWPSTWRTPGNFTSLIFQAVWLCWVA